MAICSTLPSALIATVTTRSSDEDRNFAMTNAERDSGFVCRRQRALGHLSSRGDSMTLVAGVDSSTQTCKVVVRDADSGSSPFASIIIDGKELAQLADFEHKLGPGTHTIEVQRPNDPTWEIVTGQQQLTVEPGFEPKEQRILRFEIRRK